MLESFSFPQVIFFIVGGLFSIIAFFLRDLHSRMTNVEKGLQDHRVEDAQNLVNRSELQGLRDDIRGMLSPIHSKISEIEKFLRDDKNH